MFDYSHFIINFAAFTNIYIKMRHLLIFFLIFATLPMFAQWSKTVVKGDELKGTSDGVNCVYSDDFKHIAFNEKSDNYFIVVTDKSFFNYSSIRGSNRRFIVDGLVGLYDNQDKLIERIEITFETMEKPTTVYPNKYTSKGGNNLKRSKKVIDYLKNENGYVRIVLPLYNGEEFDLKIPTLNN